MTRFPWYARLLGAVVYMRLGQWQPFHRVVWDLAHPCRRGPRWLRTYRFPHNKFARAVLRETSSTPGIGRHAKSYGGSE